MGPIFVPLGSLLFDDCIHVHYITCTCVHALSFSSNPRQRSKSGINPLACAGSFLSISSYPVRVCFLQLVAVQPIESCIIQPIEAIISVFPLPRHGFTPCSLASLVCRAQRRKYEYIALPTYAVALQSHGSHWPLNPEKQMSIRPIWMLSPYGTVRMQHVHARMCIRSFSAHLPCV
ncbi:hypothetical protein GGI42DRAFT_327964 [Trichoderma sp. SZMC 28013]